MTRKEFCIFITLSDAYMYTISLNHVYADILLLLLNFAKTLSAISSLFIVFSASTSL